MAIVGRCTALRKLKVATPSLGVWTSVGGVLNLGLLGPTLQVCTGSVLSLG